MRKEKPFRPALQDIGGILKRADNGDRLALAQLYGLLGFRITNSEIPIEERNWLAARLLELHHAIMAAAVADQDPPHFEAIIAKAAGIQKHGKGRRKLSRVGEMRKLRALLKTKAPGQDI